MSIAESPRLAGGWDELIGAGGAPRPAASALMEQIAALGVDELQHRQDLADLDVLTMGITFTVYADGRGIDRAWPFDVVPRVIDAREWLRIERGLVQRLAALNRFIDDLYNEQAVVADGVFPAGLLAASPGYLPECRGMRPAFGVWAHICGTDLVRDRDGTVHVLEDNLRIPSGVGYMLENRRVAKRTFGDLFARQSILPVDDYPDQMHRLLCSLAPPQAGPAPTVVVLTPGIYNSAYFEHSYLAQRMGVPLVEGGDLCTGPDGQVFMRTISGLAPVHVIYRRVGDRFLDPDVFEPDSTLGCRGLMAAWRAGQVAIANAPGAGVADDKVIYAWVPDLIRYYLGEEPILPNVPTYRCCYPDELGYVLAHAAHVIAVHQRLIGILAATMVRDSAFTLMRLGRHIERADMTTRLLDVRAGSLLADRPENQRAYDDHQWTGILRALSAVQMFHRTCHEPMTASTVVSFMLHAASFPRSVAYCLHAARDGIRTLPRTQLTIPAADQALTTLTAFDPAAATPQRMHQMADALQQSIGQLHQQLEAAYFR